MQKSSIFILGASGFIGSELARHLQTLGISYTCMRHRRRLPLDLHPEKAYLSSLLTFSWRKLENNPPPVIFHFARIPGSGALGRSLAANLSALSNRRLLRWLRSQTDPPLLVLTAGTLAYGPSAAVEVTEDHALNPVGFARQYAIGEQPILDAMTERTIPIQIVRPAWVYGPRSWLLGFYLLPMKLKGVVPVYGDGQNWMNLIHVEDTAGLLWHIAQNGARYQTYNLVGDTLLQQQKLSETLGRISGLPLQTITQKEISYRDPAVWESLTFSQRTSTKHRELVQQYHHRHLDLQQSLHAIWKPFITTR